jgi:type I restriction enzyme S subunit
MVPTELVGANLTQDAARVAPSNEVSPRWLLYLLRSQMFFGQMDRVAVGATIRGVNIRDLKRAKVVLPPQAEQQKIAVHLDSAVADLTPLLDKIKTGIALLRERRTALISATVTGQIDVRNWKPLKEPLGEHRNARIYSNLTDQGDVTDPNEL